MTLDEAIRHCLEVAEQNEFETRIYDEFNRQGDEEYRDNHCQCAADHRQLAEWLRKLKKANSIIRVCNRVLGFLLEYEIENTSTRHEVETLLKNITEYLSGGSEND